MKNKLNDKAKKIIKSIKKLEKKEKEISEKLSNRKAIQEKENDKMLNKINRNVFLMLAIDLSATVAVGLTSGVLYGSKAGIAAAVFGFIAIKACTAPLWGEASYLSRERRYKMFDEKRNNEEDEKRLDKIKAKSLELSSALLNECNDKKNIRAIYNNLDNDFGVYTENYNNKKEYVKKRTLKKSK